MLKGMFLDKLNTESGTVHNAIIQLGDIDDSGKGRKFISKFIQPGLVKIEGHGIVLLRKETLDASLPTIVGSPVIIQHKDVTEENADELRCGVIADARYEEFDGWYYVTGIIWDEKAQELINKGWSVSCSYDYLAVNDAGGEENNIHYDKEFTQLNFTHLAIVNNPRYERANIVFNAKDGNEEGHWVTIKGTHVFIPDGKSVDDVMKEKGWGDKENKQSDTKDKQSPDDAYKREVDIALTMMAQDYEKRGNQGTVDRANELKEKLKNGEELTERDKAHIKTAIDIYKPKEHTEEAKQRQDRINELQEALKGITHKNEKDNQSISYVPIEPVPYGKTHTQYWGIDETGKTQSTTEDKQKIYGVGLYKDYDGKEKLGLYIDYSDKPHWEVKKEPKNLLSYYGEPNAMTPEQFDDVYQKVLKQVTKNKTNNSKENDMTLIDKLQELINSVKNNKENETMVENAKVDKRKLIDEVAGIMKSAGCDDELIRTAIGKMEKIGYDDSEKSADNEKEEDKKADNVKEDDKEGAKKVDNEDAKDKKEAEDLKKDAKEDVENKCKNSVENSKDEGKAFFDRINAIYNSSKKIEEPDTPSYESRESRLEEGKKYFS